MIRLSIGRSTSTDAGDRIAKHLEPKSKAVDFYQEDDRVANVIIKRFDSNTG